MSSQGRQSSVRSTMSDQHEAPAKANGKKSKEQKDHQTNDREEKYRERAKDEGASKREGKKRPSKKEKDPRDYESEDKPRETPTPKAFSGGTGSINRQSKKFLEISESKSEENPRAVYRRSSVPNKANNAGEKDRRDSAKSKPQQTDKSESGEKTAPKPQSSEGKSQEKSVAKPRKRHELAAERDFSDPSLTQDTRSSDRKKKSATKTTATTEPSVDDTLGKVLKATIEKLKIKKFERSNASSCVNDITDKVIAHLKQNTTWCTDIERLGTGSYYENLKVSVAE